MFPKLYDDRSRERNAFTSIGRVLIAKITVEVVPARMGTLNVDITGR
jgi:hypothetical protein